MESMDVTQAKNMIIAVAKRMVDSKPLLTEVDSKIGDGDHGIGMALGFKKVQEVLAVKESQTIRELFSLVGMTMVQTMGGASGVIFGSMFLGGSQAAGEATELTLPLFAAMMDKALFTIKERGKAQPGDKTMVDALEPAVIALSIDAKEGVSFEAALEHATKAAKEGVEATKGYQAKFGRAKSLMERAIGFQDAGATSVWIIFDTMREWAEINC